MSPCHNKNIRITQIGVTTNFIAYFALFYAIIHGRLNSKLNVLSIVSTVQFCGISYSGFPLMDKETMINCDKYCGYIGHDVGARILTVSLVRSF